MTRGRRPLPTHMHVVNGNPSKKALNKDEPKPEGDLADPPDHFSESQCDIWRYAISHAPAGMLKKLDLSILEIWVTACDIRRRALEKMGDKLLVRTPKAGAPMQNPYLPIINKQASIMIQAASELGFTPSSRSRVVVGAGSADGAQENPFNRFRKRG